MTHVLDCQSDAIVVTKQNHLHFQSTTKINRTCPALEPLPFEFCNSKSTELLGFKLDDPETDAETMRELRLEFETPQFIRRKKTSKSLFEKYTVYEIQRLSSLRIEMLTARRRADLLEESSQSSY